MHDLHNNCQVKSTIEPIAVGTTGTGITGNVIDTQGYGGVEIVCHYGAITATNAVFTVVVKDGDVTGTMASVADANLLGTELLAGVAATTPRVDGTSEKVNKRVGYRGGKRYVQADISSTITAGTPISASVILHSPNVAPTDNP